MMALYATLLALAVASQASALNITNAVGGYFV
jgi:hypothetical protein